MPQPDDENSPRDPPPELTLADRMQQWNVRLDLVFWAVLVLTSPYWISRIVDSGRVAESALLFTSIVVGGSITWIARNRWPAVAVIGVFFVYGSCALILLLAL